MAWKVSSIQHAVHLQVESQSVSPVVAQEAAEAEAVAQQRFEQRQEALAQKNFAQELDAVRSDVDAIQSKISTLRQVKALVELTSTRPPLQARIYEQGHLLCGLYSQHIMAAEIRSSRNTWLYSSASAVAK